jgi:hypothetical protein
MEAVYYLEDKVKKDLDTLMSDEFFKRLGVLDREAKLMGTKRTSGYYFYVKADSPEKFKIAEEKVAESKIPVTKLSGEEEKAVIEAIKREEEEAASGMGAIFG